MGFRLCPQETSLDSPFFLWKPMFPWGGRGGDGKGTGQMLGAKTLSRSSCRVSHSPGGSDTVCDKPWVVSLHWKKVWNCGLETGVSSVSSVVEPHGFWVRVASQACAHCSRDLARWELEIERKMLELVHLGVSVLAALLCRRSSTHPDKNAYSLMSGLV